MVNNIGIGSDGSSLAKRLLHYFTAPDTDYWLIYQVPNVQSIKGLTVTVITVYNGLRVTVITGYYRQRLTVTVITPPLQRMENGTFAIITCDHTVIAYYRM